MLENWSHQKRAIPRRYAVFKAYSEDDDIILLQPGNEKVLQGFPQFEAAGPQDRVSQTVHWPILLPFLRIVRLSGSVLVTAGIGIEEISREYEASHDDFNAIWPSLGTG